MRQIGSDDFSNRVGPRASSVPPTQVKGPLAIGSGLRSRMLDVGSQGSMFDVRVSMFKLCTLPVELHHPAMNFLVTGGAGFIGYHGCDRLLRDGHAVWVFDDLNHFYHPAIMQANLRRLGICEDLFSWGRGDLTDRVALDELFGGVGFDQVVHLAARAGVRPSLLEPDRKSTRLNSSHEWISR